MRRRPSKAQVESQFRAFNAAFFGGTLPPVPVHWQRARGYGLYSEPGVKGEPGVVDKTKYPYGLIHLSTMEQPQRGGWRAILLHEMVHAWLFLCGMDDQSSDHDTIEETHGPVFATACNVIGARMGLPEVSVEECWTWPWGLYHAEHFIDAGDDE